MGPRGWIGGWAIVVADIIVMANLAQIAASTLPAVRRRAPPTRRRGHVVGVVWIVAMTVICVYGIELSARTQVACSAPRS